MNKRMHDKEIIETGSIWLFDIIPFARFRVYETKTAVITKSWLFWFIPLPTFTRYKQEGQ